MKHFSIGRVTQMFFNEEDEMKTIETNNALRVSTMELYDNFFDSLKDVVWSEPDHPNYDEFFKIAKALAAGSVSTIRNAFTDGFTPMLLGTKMNELELLDNKEIRVYHKFKDSEKLIGVIIDQEISY
jgi:hypothetical protein